MYSFDNYPQPAGYFKAADGISLPYFVYGEDAGKDTIFLLNGFTCNQFNIAKIIDGLTPHFRIVTFDYRGQGLAYREKYQQITVDAVLSDIDALHDHIGRIPIHLMGYSMGCQLAVEWNHRGNHHVRSVVLLMGIYGNIFDTFLNLRIFAPILKLTKELFPALKSLYRLAWRTAHRLPYPVRVGLGRGTLLNPDLVKEEELRPFLDQLADLDFEYLLHMADAIHEHSNEGQFHSIAAPCLVISGESDLFALPIHSERVHQAVQHSWYFSVPRGTHNAVLENAADIVGWILEFYTAKEMLKVKAG